MNRTTTVLFAAGALAAVSAGVLIGRLTARPDSSRPPVASSPESPSEAVALSAARVRSAGIELVRAERTGSATEVLAQALVTAKLDAEAALASPAEGTLIRLFKGLGDPVRAGETVALLQSREAAAMSGDVGKALAQLEAARAKYAREKRLFEGKVTARQDFEAARADLGVAEAEARRAREAASGAKVVGGGKIAIVSPVAGRISSAPAQLGAVLSAGAEVYRVVDPTRIEVRASVAGSDAEVSIGDPVKVEAQGTTVGGVVRGIAPGLDPTSRTSTVVVALASGAELLRPGQAVQVRIATRRTASIQALSVPDEAVQLIGGREVVFVRTATGFRVQPITVGARGGGRAAIASGLRDGAVVAGRNAFLLKAELQKPTEEEGAE